VWLIQLKNRTGQIEPAPLESTFERHGFSRAAKPTKTTRALAPEGRPRIRDTFVQSIAVF
jgi:hypothetical protein